MIPLRDNIPSRSLPLVTFGLAALNVAVFVHEVRLGRALEPFLYRYGMVPAAWSDPLLSARLDLLDKITPVFTSMFLHGGLLHLVANVWSLLLFGDNVEDRLGHLRYLLFYLFCGVMAGLLHLFTNWGSTVPVIGASGAIAGVMGAYLVLYPRARILTVVPVFIFLHYAEVPAFFYLAFWFFMQLYSGLLAPAAGSGIAWWAHVGGFVAGVYYVLRFRSPRRR